MLIRHFERLKPRIYCWFMVFGWMFSVQGYSFKQENIFKKLLHCHASLVYGPLSGGTEFDF